MKNVIIALSVCLLTVVLSSAGFCQDGDCVTVKQDGTGDYSSIQAAIDDTFRASDDIVVFPGIYKENIIINSGVTLRAYDGPYYTAIDGSTRNNERQNTIYVEPQTKNVKIIGFYITGGKDGVNVDTSTHVFVSNCVIHENDENGITLYWDVQQEKTYVEIFNCVFMSNAQNGIYIKDSEWYIHLYPCAIKNNIFFQNSNYGICLEDTNIYNPDLLVINNNSYFGNENYSRGIGKDQTVKVGNGELVANPQFIGKSESGVGIDLRLSSKSPCRDKGSESATFNDPDGTRNDMGAYGGPWAATFYEAPNDGPVVRKVTVSPGSIPQGETFVIKAVGTVR